MDLFNLEKALAGAKLRTFNGVEVSNFRVNPGTDKDVYPYLYDCGDSAYRCTTYGQFNTTGKRHFADLYMAEEQTDIEPLKAGEWIMCTLYHREPYTTVPFEAGTFYQVQHRSDNRVSLGRKEGEGVLLPVDVLELKFDLSTRTTENPYPLGQNTHKLINTLTDIADRRVATILGEAQELIYGERQADYGSVTENFTDIATGWAPIFKDGVTPEKVGLAMVWLKTVRQLHRNKRDNLVDIAGYVGCIDKLQKGE